MIQIGNKGVGAIEHLKKGVAFVYHLGKLVWSKIRSCYASGAWRNDYPWTNDDCWKNG